MQLFEVLQTYINTRRLVAMPTEGNLWFACDTKESLLEAANQEVRAQTGHAFDNASLPHSS